ncbi:hypothetical protein RYX36_026348 [Vicia faba]
MDRSTKCLIFINVSLFSGKLSHFFSISLFSLFLFASLSSTHYSPPLLSLSPQTLPPSPPLSPSYLRLLPPLLKKTKPFLDSSSHNLSNEHVVFLFQAILVLEVFFLWSNVSTFINNLWWRTKNFSAYSACTEQLCRREAEDNV